MARSDWFEESRFGMFIHWGLYSIPAGVWKGRKNKHPYSEWLQASEHVPRQEYKQLAQAFNPVDFDAESWIREAHNAGMKYFLITAKHHDGFALWPTKVSSYNVMDATPFKRDILGELAEACRKYDMKLGFYYSHWQDWEGTGGDVCEVHMVNEEYVHPSQEAFEHYWQTKCLAQVEELIDNYDPWFFWFDSWGDYSGKGDFTGPYLTPERQEELISLIRRKSDKCLVNSRICFTAPSDNVDYLSMMDNCFPEECFDKPWETSGTLNHSWAYHQLDFDWKSTEQLLKFLINNASYGGNYQLNVGPMPDGRFQPAAIKRLRDIGNWMAVNGEAVYGTKASNLPKQSWGRVTAKKGADGLASIYLHLYDFTPGNALLVGGADKLPVRAQVLESGQTVDFDLTANGLRVRIPAELRGMDLPVIRLDLA